MGRAFVSNRIRHLLYRTRPLFEKRFGDSQPGFFDKLKRRVSGLILEGAIEVRRTHIAHGGQDFDAERLFEMRPDVFHNAQNTGEFAVFQHGIKGRGLLLTQKMVVELFYGVLNEEFRPVRVFKVCQ